MSILTVTVEPSRVLVAVDSIVITEQGQRFSVSKLMLIPQENVILAMRGNVFVLHNVFLQCFTRLWTFDQCLEQAAALFKEQLAALETEGKKQGIPEAFYCGSQELVIAGYSESHLKLRAVRFSKAEDGGASVKEITDGFLAPGAAFTEAPATPTTDAEIRSIAERQMRWMRAEEPEQASGGKLIVAELTRRQSTVRSLGTLGENIKSP